MENDFNAQHVSSFILKNISEDLENAIDKADLTQVNYDWYSKHMETICSQNEVMHQFLKVPYPLLEDMENKPPIEKLSLHQKEKSPEKNNQKNENRKKKQRSIKQDGNEKRDESLCQNQSKAPIKKETKKTTTTKLINLVSLKNCSRSEKTQKTIFSENNSRFSYPNKMITRRNRKKETEGIYGDPVVLKYTIPHKQVNSNSIQPITQTIHLPSRNSSLKITEQYKEKLKKYEREKRKRILSQVNQKKNAMQNFLSCFMRSAGIANEKEKKMNQLQKRRFSYLKNIDKMALDKEVKQKVPQNSDSNKINVNYRIAQKGFPELKNCQIDVQKMFLESRRRSSMLNILRL